MKFVILACVLGYSSQGLAAGDDQVLNLMEQGFRDFSSGSHQDARSAFDQALMRIETVFSDSESSRKARSLWYGEDNKAFKGEPYERAMAYYYRGLLYLMTEEYGNARASFVGGLMQDAFAEEAQNRSDFASLMMLSAWSARLMGSSHLEKDAFDELIRFRPDYEIPDQGHNTLVVVETGAAPRKLADGVGHYELVYRRGKGIEDLSVSLAYDGGIKLYPLEDLFWQASTRGGRQVDRIVKGKAVFKSDNAAFGSGLSKVANKTLAFSSLFESSTEVAAISGALSLIGVGQMAMASKVDARVDTRYWSNLPELIHVTSLKLDPSIKTLSFEVLDDFDDPVAELNRQAEVIRDNKGNALVWLRIE